MKSLLDPRNADTVVVPVEQRKPDLDVSMDSVDLNMSVEVQANDDQVQAEDDQVQADPVWVKKMQRLSKAELIDELDNYRRKTEALEAKVKKFEVVNNLFVVQPSRGGSFTYSPVLDSFGLGLLCDGVSGADIARMCNGLAELCPDLINDDEIDKRQLPTKSYFNSLRAVVPELNKSQLENFLKHSKELTVTVDDSPVGSRFSALGMSLINDRGHVLALAIKETEMKTGEEIADEMRRTIDSTGFADQILPKLKAVMSDRKRAQVKGNRLFIRQLHEELGVAVVQIPCLMHLDFGYKIVLFFDLSLLDLSLLAY